MTKRRPWIARVGAGVLSALLVLSFIPLTGCSSTDTSESENSGSTAVDSEMLDRAPRSASEDIGGSAQAATVDYDTSTYVSPEEKWESADDGSVVLDVVEPYVNENAASQTLTVKTEGNARFADAVSADAVTATGGMAEWAVVSVSRLSETEISIGLSRPESPSDAAMAASSASLSIAASCIEVPTESSSEDDAAIQEVREKLEASSEEDGETFLSEDDDSIDLAALENDAAYDVSIPFVHPSLLVDVADTQVGQSATVYRIVASEFSFPANVSAGDFSVQAERIGSSRCGCACRAGRGARERFRVGCHRLLRRFRTRGPARLRRLDYECRLEWHGRGGLLPLGPSRCLGRCGGGSLRRQFRGRSRRQL